MATLRLITFALVAAVVLTSASGKRPYITATTAAAAAAAAASSTGNTGRRFDPSFNLLASPYEYSPRWNSENSDTPTYYMEVVHSTLKLTCDADGRPRPKVTWYKDSKPFTSRPSGELKKRHHWLKLSNLLPEDSGIYTCVVTNRQGQLSRTVTLDVVTRVISTPEIVKKLHNMTAADGDNVTLHCRYYSDLLAAVRWTKTGVDGDNTEEDVASDVTELQSEYDNVTDSSRLVLHNVTSDDTGIYTCHVINSIGAVKSSAVLRVLPAVPTSPPWPEVLTAVNRPVYLVVSVVLVGFVLLICVVVVLLVRRRRLRRFQKCSIVISDLSAAPLGHHQQLLYCGSDPMTSECHVTVDPQWELDFKSIEQHQLLGEGAYGQVFKATVRGKSTKNRRQTVAIKRLKEGATESEVKAFINEIETMKTVGQHVNVIAFIGCCTQQGRLLVAVEFALHGSLRDLLRANRPVDTWSPRFGGYGDTDNQSEPSASPRTARVDLTSKLLITFAYQAARGMEFLASKKIIHRDLAARNVLVADKFVAKIADFGLTKTVANTGDYYRHRNDCRMPMKWLAPESLLTNTFTTSSDVWSFGVLLWEIFSYGDTPYASVPVVSLSRVLKDGYRMPKPHHAPQNIYDIMCFCWADAASSRPTFSQLVQTLDTVLTHNVSAKYLNLLQPTRHPVNSGVNSSINNDTSLDFESSSGDDSSDNEDENIDSDTVFNDDVSQSTASTIVNSVNGCSVGSTRIRGGSASLLRCSSDSQYSSASSDMSPGSTRRLRYDWSPDSSDLRRGGCGIAAAVHRSCCGLHCGGGVTSTAVATAGFGEKLRRANAMTLAPAAAQSSCATSAHSQTVAAAVAAAAAAEDRSKLLSVILE